MRARRTGAFCAAVSPNAGPGAADESARRGLSPTSKSLARSVCGPQSECMSVEQGPSSVEDPWTPSLGTLGPGAWPARPTGDLGRGRGCACRLLAWRAAGCRPRVDVPARRPRSRVRAGRPRHRCPGVPVERSRLGGGGLVRRRKLVRRRARPRARGGTGPSLPPGTWLARRS